MEQRAGTVLNLTAKKHETALGKALKKVVVDLRCEFPYVLLDHQPRWQLAEIVDHLKQDFPDVPFEAPHEQRWLEPDGGILSIVDRWDKQCLGR